MKYTRYTIALEAKPEEVARQDIYDLLSASLVDIGFDSFEQETDKLLAYIPNNLPQDKELNNLIDCLPFEGLRFSWTKEEMPDINWNEEWEKNYFQPIIIGDNLCQIRAPFHEPNKEVKTEIIISPKMAFGTGNHETTALMMSYILSQELQGKRVLDMGCGTGILGILALKQGAHSLTAIDIDEWAYLNVLENAELNNVTIDLARQGDASSLSDLPAFDLILANITRNILWEDMPRYTDVLHDGGRLILSGFYEEDIPMLVERGKALGLQYASQETRNNWARVELIKTT